MESIVSNKSLKNGISIAYQTKLESFVFTSKNSDYSKIFACFIDLLSSKAEQLVDFVVLFSQFFFLDCFPENVI